MSQPSASLILIRHLETDAGDFSSDGDPPLSKTGRQQAAKLVSALRTHRIAQVYASDLTRARQTAEILAHSFGIPLTLRSEFRELSPDRSEALPIAEQAVTAALDDILARHGNSTVAIVAHSGTMRAMIRHLLQLPLGTYDLPSVARGGWLTLRKSASGAWSSLG
jgi:broad specificity phosphatase PhoE